jgi:hypothetical protein
MADKPQPLTAERLRSELEKWATRTAPWTGPASMTAEDGYNAAIEEVVAILNYRDQAAARVAAPSDGLREALARYRAALADPRAGTTCADCGHTFEAHLLGVVCCDCVGFLATIPTGSLPHTGRPHHGDRGYNCAACGTAATPTDDRPHKVGCTIYPADHDGFCPTDDPGGEPTDAEKRAWRAGAEFAMPVAAPSDGLRAKAETLECIRQHFGATRRCDEYDDGRELCAPCYVRTALAATPTDD